MSDGFLNGEEGPGNALTLRRKAQC